MKFGELLHRMVSPVAALLRDGLVLAAAQEERFTRRKHDSNFPHHAIRSRLESMGTRPSFLRKEQQNQRDGGHRIGPVPFHCCKLDRCAALRTAGRGGWQRAGGIPRPRADAAARIAADRDRAAQVQDWRSLGNALALAAVSAALAWVLVERWLPDGGPLARLALGATILGLACAAPFARRWAR